MNFFRTCNFNKNELFFRYLPRILFKRFRGLLSQNTSLWGVTSHSLLVTRWNSLVVKSLVPRCKTCSLLVMEVARCKRSLVTCCKIRSLLVAELLQKAPVSCCEIPSILIAKNHSLLKQLPARIIVCLKLTKLDESFSFWNIIYFLGTKNSKFFKSTY